MVSACKVTPWTTILYLFPGIKKRLKIEVLEDRFRVPGSRGRGCPCASYTVVASGAHGPRLLLPRPAVPLLWPRPPLSAEEGPPPPTPGRAELPEAGAGAG